MKFLKFLVAMPLLVASLGSAIAAVTDLKLPEHYFPDLDAVLKKAVQQSPTMLSKTVDLEIAENNRIMARANLLPSLTSYASAYYAQDNRADIGTSNLTKVAYGITLSQPIYFWGERSNLARIGVIQSTIAKGNYREGYRLLVQELRTDYMHLISQKIAVQRARFNLDFITDQMKQHEDRWAKKVISDAEIWTLRLNAEQYLLARDRAEFDFENAKVAYGLLAGISPPADDAIPDAIPSAPYDAAPLNQMLATFLSLNDPPTNEAEADRNQIAVENLNYANQKTHLKPKLSFVLGNSQDEESYTVNSSAKYKVNSLFGGLSFNWAIFDGFTTGAAIRNSLARRRQLEDIYRQAKDRLGRDAQNQVKLIAMAARGMSINDRFQSSGEGNYSKVQEDHTRGVKAEADVSVARLALYDAQLNANSSRTEYLWRLGEFLGIVAEDPALANLPTP